MKERNQDRKQSERRGYDVTKQRDTQRESYMTVNLWGLMAVMTKGMTG